MMYNNWGWSGMMGGFGFGWIITILFWALVIWAIIALVRHGRWEHGGCCGRHDHGEDKPEESKKSALDILDERYAKGEINKEEYEQKKKDILNK